MYDNDQNVSNKPRLHFIGIEYTNKKNLIQV